MKYLLPENLADVLVPKLLKHMDWDPYAEKKPGKKYYINSLYYDSCGFACYYEKIAGLEKRKKLRLRVYEDLLNPNTKVYIEIKRKDNIIVLKDRIIASFNDCCQSFLKGDYNILRKNRPEKEISFINEFIWTKDYNCFKPQILISYCRSPLVGKIDQRFRVTFDSDLTAVPADWLTVNKAKIPVCPGFVIMEVKFNNTLPAWFHEIIKDYNLERISFSKYCMGVDACRQKNLISITNYN